MSIYFWLYINRRILFWFFLKSYFIICCQIMWKTFNRADRNTHCLSYCSRGKSNQMKRVLWLQFVISKAYGCNPHDLLLAKLNTYGICSVGLLLVSDYLSCRKQRRKIRWFYGSWHDVIRGVPQGSILAPSPLVCFSLWLFESKNKELWLFLLIRLKLKTQTKEN